MNHITAQTAPAFDPALDGDHLPLTQTFHPLGFTVEVSTNHHGVLDAAAGLWSFLKPRRLAPVIHIRVHVSNASSGDCPPSPAFDCQRHLMSLIADTNNYATCDLRANFGFARITRSTINHRLYFQYHFLEAMTLGILSAINAPALHAACVSANGQGFLLCGPSGAGKSTLAYACARAGFVYTTDDASYLLRNEAYPSVVGQSHKIRFRPHSRELFPELRHRDQTPRMEGKPSIEVPTSELEIVTSQEARIDHLVLLDRRQSGDASVRQIPTSVAIDRLMEGLYPTDDIRKEQIAALRMLEQQPAYELRYASLGPAIDLIRSIARSGDGVL